MQPAGYDPNLDCPLAYAGRPAPGTYHLFAIFSPALSMKAGVDLLEFINTFMGDLIQKPWQDVSKDDKGSEARLEDMLRHTSIWPLQIYLHTRKDIGSPVAYFAFILTIMALIKCLHLV